MIVLSLLVDWSSANHRQRNWPSTSLWKQKALINVEGPCTLTNTGTVTLPSTLFYIKSKGRLKSPSYQMKKAGKSQQKCLTMWLSKRKNAWLWKWPLPQKPGNKTPTCRPSSNTNPYRLKESGKTRFINNTWIKAYTGQPPSMMTARCLLTDQSGQSWFSAI